MNPNGQSFDVFKLLIAAVIAVVILAMLLSILGVIKIFGEKPAEVAGGMIVSLKNSPYSPQTKQAKFSTNDSITADNLAVKSNGMSMNQICIAKNSGSGMPDDIWKMVNAPSNALYSVAYTGSVTMDAEIVGICGTKSTLKERLQDGTFDTAGFKGEWFESCNCLNEEEEIECCVFAVTR